MKRSSGRSGGPAPKRRRTGRTRPRGYGQPKKQSKSRPRQTRAPLRAEAALWKSQMYTSLYTYSVQVNALNSPGTLWNLTKWSDYVKRFDSQGAESPVAWIKSAWVQYQLDALSTTPQPMVAHVWVLSPKHEKYQSTTGANLVMGDVNTDIDCNSDGSDPLLNYPLYKVHGYRKHLVARTTSEATALSEMRTQSGMFRLKMPKIVRSMAGTAWKNVNMVDVPFSQQVYLYVYLEVTASGTGTPIQASFRSTLKVCQSL